ncbi:hypothetical protein ES288_D08G276600v1 [Gossypium darwinii]|uniref:Uncharacterized protein n=1 Tax=Gossypium darwinii TaxID=34276 RepID=A0A5D2BU87_GOSDA|nr:hypothetical protein ES288_D08G276500v1 [Gossypium darwinii]TYG59116.1 hypothetical protein ES288_D08G276600v1 [Gossypium darwinii]
MRGRLPPALWSAFRDQGSETVKRGENGKSPPLPKLASDDGEGSTTTTASGADSGYGRCWWWGCQTHGGEGHAWGVRRW